MKFAGKSGDAAMSVTARIRQRSIFKKKLNRDDILQLTGLAYGVSDENFVLCRGEKADHTLIYDETKLARGLDLWLEDTDILLSLSLPTSPSEIRLFYEVIAKICGRLNTSRYLREDVQAAISESETYIKWDEDASRMALEDIEEKTGDAYKRFELFGVFNPISIGQRELAKIHQNPENLEAFLNEIQSQDVYYAAPHVFRRKATDQLLGVYSVAADIPCVVPTEPYIVLNQIKGIKEWYVMVRSEKTVKYKDFINNVKNRQYYDANHAIVLLNDHDIDDLLGAYSAEL